jgi:ankyrin repeat protein
LYIAAQNGHCHVVKYLIESGANIESTFKDGFTPIYIAAQKGHTAIVEELIKHGANIEARGGDR